MLWACVCTKRHNCHMRSLDGTVFLSSMADISMSPSNHSFPLPFFPVFALVSRSLLCLFVFFLSVSLRLSSVVLLWICYRRFSRRPQRVSSRASSFQKSSRSFINRTHTHRTGLFAPVQSEAEDWTVWLNHYLPVGSFHCEGLLFQVKLVLCYVLFRKPLSYVSLRQTY